MPVDFGVFREKLNAFIFFHLGADAVCKVEEKDSVLMVDLEHRRIHSFSFRVDPDTLARFLSDDRQFEDFMLEQLVRHRKSH